MVDFQLVIGGEAGYGIMTTGVMLSKIATRLGLSVFDYVEYPSLIRGGHNAYYVRASDEQIYSQKHPVDILVALNRPTIDLHKHELSAGAAIIYDPNIFEVKPDEFPVAVTLYPVPLLQIAKDAGADKLMINTVAVGAALGLFSNDFEVLGTILKEVFGRKGEAIVNVNLATAKGGYDFVKANQADKFPVKVVKKETKNLLIGGAESIGIGAIKAGLKFAAIYPMTPVNGILYYLVGKADKYNLVVKEPEDEIAGINMAIGASFAGARSMVASAGGGFSLMVEALGLAAQTETPLVIIEGMRPGPATGMPTWTNQADFRFVLHAAQDEFPRVVVVVGDALEAYEQTMHAFNIADKYQLQVIVVTDKYLNEGHTTQDSEKFKAIAANYKVQRGKILSDDEAAAQTDYKRYTLTDDGISPRSLPGQKAIGFSGSDEHDERGLYNETSEVRLHMMDKRFKKLAVAIAAGEFPAPVLHGPSQAEVTIFALGTTKMPIMEAIKWLAKENIIINFVQTSFIAPFPSEPLAAEMKRAKKTLVIEANHDGQFEGLVREHTGLTFDHRLRKYDGRPFYPEDIVAFVKSLLTTGEPARVSITPTAGDASKVT